MSNALDATINAVNEGYQVSTAQKVTRAGVEIRHHFNNGSAGVQLSRLLTTTVSEKSIGNVAASPLTNYAAFTTFQFGMVTAWGSLSRHSCHLSIFEIMQLSNGGIRTFPLFLSDWHYAGGADVSWHSGSASVLGNVRYSSSNSGSAAENAMPNSLKALMRRGEISLQQYFMGADIAAKAWIDGGGAFLEGYDAHAYNYLLLDSLLLINPGGAITLSWKNGTTATVFGETWKGSCPYGLLSMAPFSSWSLFYPVKYRLLAAGQRYSEYGLHVRYHIPMGKRQSIDLNCSGSRIAGIFDGIRQERTLAVFIPYYTNTIYFTNFHFSGTLLRPYLEYSVTNGPVSISASVKQYIPFITNHAPDNKPGVVPGPQMPFDTETSIVEKKRGGTVWGFSARLSY